MAPIPVAKFSNKLEKKHIYLSPEHLEANIFHDRIMSQIDEHVRYTVFIKVRYLQNNFFYFGNQFSFMYENRESLLRMLSDTLWPRIEQYYSQYAIDELDIVYFQFTFIKFNQRLFSESLVDPKNQIGRASCRERVF